ncbi:hypothetical protein ABIB38_000029 [Massilia sp. UYP11]|uniref:hypothetical protein n=1 Tax=Massilia sp. UYP11 TaxID=1756385 RepID=UPI003D24BF49
MKTITLLLLLTCLSLHAAERMPSDVSAFVERRDACDHFRGEIPEPQDIERMKEVSRQIDKFCRGTDARLARLKKKYGDNPVVLRRLNEYEDQIEPKSRAH